MQDQNNRLVLVTLIDMTLCLSCRFAATATVEMADGTRQRMLHCKRLDCDNWQTDKKESAPLIRRVTL